MRLRNRVRITRLLRGLHQETLAQSAGISRNTLGKVERDNGYEPTGEVMRKLAAALDDEGIFWFERDGSEIPADKEV